MKAAIVALLVMVFGLPTQTFAGDDDLDKLVAGLPKDAAAVVTQLAMCQHFAGEEPYDRARAREIVRAEKQYKCETLDADEAAVRKRYPNDRKLLRRPMTFESARTRRAGWQAASSHTGLGRPRRAP
jgi:hypothetical protein